MKPPKFKGTYTCNSQSDIESATALITCLVNTVAIAPFHS